MKISSLKIERFGVWEDLNLPKISRGLNVFFGPNEAGKTTLMQFIRTCIYGGGDEDRARYIQMALDGRRRRDRGQEYASAFIPSSDPRRVDPNAAAKGERTDVPEELRRFIQPGKKVENVPSDAKAAATDTSRAWIGGAATVTSDFGEHRLERRYIRRDSNYQSAVERKAGFVVSDGLLNWSGRFYSLPGRKIAESLVVTGPDGTRVGDYIAKSLACNLDESTYNGIFAIGLDELQRLGMLNETEAAQMLYRLSVGVDRGAFVQVFQQIVAERNDLLDPKGRPSILENLIEEREAARRGASESASDLREYSRLIEERRAVMEAVANLQERLEKATRQKSLKELALRVAGSWDEREKASGELESMGDVPVVEQKAVDECEQLLNSANNTLAQVKDYKKKYVSLRGERDAIEVDPSLDDLEPRVKILEDDLPRLVEIDEQISKLRAELDELKAKLLEEDARMRSEHNGKIMLTQAALDAINASSVAGNMAPQEVLANSAKGQNAQNNGSAQEQPAVILPNKLAEQGVPFKEVEDFKIPAKAMRRRRMRLQKCRDEFKLVSESLAVLVDKLEQGLTSRRQKNLTEAIEKTGALVTGLRRRIEIEKSLADSAVYRKELERLNRTLTEQLSIQGSPFYALCAGVGAGALIFGLALFGKVDLVFGLLGLLAAVGCLIYKTTVEHRNRLRLEDNQRRLGLVVKQMEQAQDEANRLDERFPAPNDSTANFEARYKAAEADLKFFHSLAPVEAQWREATRGYRAQEARVKKAEEALKAARKRWKTWLHNAYLPTTLKPAQVRELLARVGIAEDLQRQIESIGAEIEYLGRERQGIVDRFNATLLLVEKYHIAETVPDKVVAKLRELLAEHADVLKERARLLEEMTTVKRECRKALALRRGQVREARRFLAGYFVKSKEELIAAVQRYDLYLRRAAELDNAQARLDAGIAGFCPEEEIDAILSDETAREELPASIENLGRRIDAFNAELKGKLELSGRLGQQADAISAKTSSIRRRFEAVAADLRLAKMAELWQSRAVAAQMMEDIRRAYEKERQPETLREASRYLKRLTNGAYVNIWTPLGEDALFVDASNGETLDVAALSRGTRELLFIAIRLALVVSFEKHGVQMPLIWDDVLVNFDYKRAATAAKLLYDFAKQGRQIFLFTCHEHICKLFLDLGVSVCVLPTQTDPAKRRFRVLSPVKKSNSEVTIDVERSENGPNFHEESESSFMDSYAVESDESKPGSEERGGYAVADEVERANDVQLETEPEEPSTEPENVKVDAPEVVLSVNETSEKNEEEAQTVDEAPVVSVDEAFGEKIPHDEFVYSTIPEDAKVEYVAHNLTLDGGAEFRPLSEVSPTLSAEPKNDEQELRVVDKKSEKPAQKGPYSDGEVDYIPVEAQGEFDSTEWNNFFNRGRDPETPEESTKFGDYMIDETNAENYGVDDDVYEDEYEEDDDRDDRG